MTLGVPIVQLQSIWHRSTKPGGNGALDPKEIGSAFIEVNGRGQGTPRQVEAAEAQSHFPRGSWEAGCENRTGGDPVNGVSLPGPGTDQQLPVLENSVEPQFFHAAPTPPSQAGRFTTNCCFLDQSTQPAPVLTKHLYRGSSS